MRNTTIFRRSLLGALAGLAALVLLGGRVVRAAPSTVVQVEVPRMQP
jgi:hypothetical protein